MGYGTFQGWGNPFRLTTCEIESHYGTVREFGITDGFPSAQKNENLRVSSWKGDATLHMGQCQKSKFS